MKLRYFLAPLLAVALTGCAEMAEKDAVIRAKAHCESEGKQFIQRDAELHDGLVMSTATVSGVCVGPGDPGYVTPQAPQQK